MMNSNPPSVSFISIFDFSEEVWAILDHWVPLIDNSAKARWIYLTDSVTELLGFDVSELRNTSLLGLVHPNDYNEAKQIHLDIIRQNKAAHVMYARLKHKDPLNGYILCAVSRTCAFDVVVGSVSLATHSKAFYNASTAQEVQFVGPDAETFKMSRWTASRVLHEASPSPSQDSTLSTPPAPSDYNQEGHISSHSRRTAFILGRFTVKSTILYSSNNLIIPSNRVLNRSFLDFVVANEETTVRSYLEVVKGWGVNDKGHPSDGGFGFGKFSLLLDGRDSGGLLQAPRSSHRPSSSGGRSSLNASRPTGQPTEDDVGEGELSVDAIFSAHSDGLLVVIRPSEI